MIVPPTHPLAVAADAGEPLTLAHIARHPIVTYETGYTGHSHFDDAFAVAGLATNIVLEAMDADVIKTYVELGMGVGIVAAIAYDAQRDAHLRAIDARHLFALNMTRLAIRRGAWLRGYVYDFFGLSETKADEKESPSEACLNVLLDRKFVLHAEKDGAKVKSHVRIRDAIRLLAALKWAGRTLPQASVLRLT